jgi:hypothetical protein
MRPSNRGAKVQELATTTANSSTEILTVIEVAQRLRVAPSWVYGHADLLGAYRLGKYLRFDWKRVLERLLGSETEGADIGVTAQRPSPRSVNP